VACRAHPFGSKTQLCWAKGRPAQRTAAQHSTDQHWSVCLHAPAAQHMESHGWREAAETLLAESSTQSNHNTGHRKLSTQPAATPAFANSGISALLSNIKEHSSSQPASQPAINSLHCTALHCTALHCTALHCTALHCTALHCSTLFTAQFAIRTAPANSTQTARTPRSAAVAGWTTPSANGARMRRPFP
jgi:hypothetical protein